MSEEIKILREKLEMQVLGNEAYDEIVKTSKQLDILLVEYYKSLHYEGQIA